MNPRDFGGQNINLSKFYIFVLDWSAFPFVVSHVTILNKLNRVIYIPATSAGVDKNVNYHIV